MMAEPMAGSGGSIHFTGSRSSLLGSLRSTSQDYANYVQPDGSIGLERCSPCRPGLLQRQLDRWKSSAPFSQPGVQRGGASIPFPRDPYSASSKLDPQPHPDPISSPHGLIFASPCDPGDSSGAQAGPVLSRCPNCLAMGQMATSR